MPIPRPRPGVSAICGGIFPSMFMHHTSHLPPGGDEGARGAAADGWGRYFDLPNAIFQSPLMRFSSNRPGKRRGGPLGRLRVCRWQFQSRRLRVRVRRWQFQIKQRVIDDDCPWITHLVGPVGKMPKMAPKRNAIYNFLCTKAKTNDTHQDNQPYFVLNKPYTSTIPAKNKQSQDGKITYWARKASNRQPFAVVEGKEIGEDDE